MSLVTITLTNKIQSIALENFYSKDIDDNYSDFTDSVLIWPNGEGVTFSGRLTNPDTTTIGPVIMKIPSNFSGTLDIIGESLIPGELDLSLLSNISKLSIPIYNNGTFPDITSLTQLELLYFNGDLTTSLSFPAFSGSLSSSTLQQIHFINCKMTGSIPNLDHFSALEVYSFDDNALDIESMLYKGQTTWCGTEGIPIRFSPIYPVDYDLENVLYLDFGNGYVTRYGVTDIYGFSIINKTDPIKWYSNRSDFNPDPCYGASQVSSFTDEELSEIINEIQRRGLIK